MPLVSKADRSQYLQSHHPVLCKLCLGELPEPLQFRLNTFLPFCYGRSDGASSVPAVWDHEGVLVVPLWEDSDSLTAIRVVSGLEEYVEICFEDVNEVDVVSRSVEGLLFYLLFFLVESQGGPDYEGFGEIEALAEYLEVDWLDQVVNCVAKYSQRSDLDEFREWLRSGRVAGNAVNDLRNP